MTDESVSPEVNAPITEDHGPVPQPAPVTVTGDGPPLRVLGAGEKDPNGGVWPMPDLPYAQRAILTILDRDVELLGEHSCVWPDGVDPGESTYVGDCTCGGLVRFANQLAAMLGSDPAFPDSAQREAAEAWMRHSDDLDAVVSATVRVLRERRFVQ